MAEKSKPREGNLSRTIAEYVLNPPALGAETKDRAKKALVDTVSANLAGTTCEVFPVFKAYLAEAGAGDRVILGSSIRCAPEYAAMINGTMISSLEFDDVLSLMPGHPSAAVMAVLCADESALKATGKEVLDAYAIGIQAGARVAQACTMDHYFRGFHGTGTMTMFSAIAALCRINKFSLEQIQRALGIAASFAAGVQGNFGTMTKPLHSGWAARNAYEAVRLAKAGLTSSEYVFEVEGGFFDCYGSENSSVKHVEDILAAPWVFDEPGITMKLFPCCYADFRGMDGLMKLRDRMGVTPSDVEKVVCYVPPGSLTPLPFPRPTTPFESLFSLPYALAVTLLDGFPGLESFTQQRVDASDVAEMLDRIEVTENEICVEKYPDYLEKSYGTRGEVRVELTTRDGRNDREIVRIAPGHPLRPLTWDQMRAKFLGCADVVGILPAQSEVLFGRLQAIDEETCFGDLIEQFHIGSKSSKPGAT